MSVRGKKIRCSLCCAHKSPSVSCPWQLLSKKGTNSHWSRNGTSTPYRITANTTHKNGTSVSSFQPCRERNPGCRIAGFSTALVCSIGPHVARTNKGSVNHPFSTLFALPLAVLDGI